MEISKNLAENAAIPSAFASQPDLQLLVPDLLDITPPTTRLWLADVPSNWFKKCCTAVKPHQTYQFRTNTTPQCSANRTSLSCPILPPLHNFFICRLE
ncbi:hypothetical protein [Glaciimonas sp. PCH181]|uniref:hypothetical protein n=1 Tax=Glaciimonas sp. PCH181 TaxID=2133943 RepID=UPI000D3CCC15|nr:hypothetical protein [Glaciimonas sp. PCH181]PUA17519.1 hypothetical protein C7W93_16620 [Glaciimonas sp. PCH181]